MSAKLIFLDFDGVLNTSKYIVSVKDDYDDAAHIDPKKVTLVNFIVAETGAKVVVSSSWRKYHTLKELDNMLKYKGATFDVIGVTPVITDDKRRVPRGEEIQAYIDSMPEKPKAIAILDDDSDMVHLSKYLIKTLYFGEGLTATHAAECCRLLQPANKA
jgi:ribosome-interacting GTPase 1